MKRLNNIDFTRSWKFDGMLFPIFSCRWDSIGANGSAHSISKLETSKRSFFTARRRASFHLPVRVPSTVKSPFFPSSCPLEAAETRSGYRASIPISGSCHRTRPVCNPRTFLISWSNPRWTYLFSRSDSIIRYLTLHRSCGILYHRWFRLKIADHVFAFLSLLHYRKSSDTVENRNRERI